MISFEGLDYDKGVKQEWLVTNGLGGYSSSTAIGVNSRKYHGLLIAALNPPVDRYQMVAKVEELVVTNKSHHLSVNKYLNLVHPQGHTLLKKFIFEDYPVFKYEIPDVSIEKSVAMVYGLNSTVVNYNITSKTSGILEVQPLVNCRSINSNTHRSQIQWDMKRKPLSKGEIISFYDGSPHLLVSSDYATYSTANDWNNNILYEWELERGYDHLEDLFSCGKFTYKFKKGRNDFNLYFAAEKNDSDLVTINLRLQRQGKALLISEKNRRQRLVDDFYRLRRRQRRNELLSDLIKAADQFIVKRKATRDKSIIAGYPWFTDWGRDTMIALRGLCLSLGRFDDAKSILQRFAKHMRNGLIPNRFTDDGGADYNTVDASLWFIVAAHEYFKYTNDKAFLKDILPKLEEVVDNYKKGTDYGISMDEDSLIQCTDSNLNLTWMDAMSEGEVFTPRTGKPVEIQALWYDSLMIMADLSTDQKKKKSYIELSKKVKESFNEKFWNEEEDCLFDVVSGDWTDGSIRPNQILAVSIRYSILKRQREKAVVLKVKDKLWTPVGLRTLPTNDPRYRGLYRGSQYERDKAYHQGTIWPWLLGPYWRSLLKTSDYSPEIKHEVWKEIMRLSENMGEHGIGTFSEIFESDTLRPDGCFAQAWSVSEIIRTLTLVI
ncbi:MAG: amylo-alpha-1,6-glucosidase [Candidatus Altiarchaeota archaeon]